MHDQIEPTFFGTTLNIPIKTKPNVRSAQLLTIILSTMTQTDVLLGFKTIILYPYKEKKLWHKIVTDTRSQTFGGWFWCVLFPNTLKIIEGLLILGITFVVIVQSVEVTELLKDYTALMVISNVDNSVFEVSENGYFGRYIMKKAQKVGNVKVQNPIEWVLSKCHINLKKVPTEIIF